MDDADASIANPTDKSNTFTPAAQAGARAMWESLPNRQNHWDKHLPQDQKDDLCRAFAAGLDTLLNSLPNSENLNGIVVAGEVRDLIGRRPQPPAATGGV